MGQLINLAYIFENRVKAIVICGWCGEHWLGNVPFSADWHMLECPGCGQMMGWVDEVCIEDYVEDEEYE